MRNANNYNRKSIFILAPECVTIRICVFGDFVLLDINRNNDWFGFVF